MNRNTNSLSLLLLASAFVFLACAIDGSRSSVAAQEWDKLRGPVVPHDDFPADCSLCHEGDDWNTIRADFVYDHAKETGHALEGAHEAAECLRCHNDRGPVQLYSVRGCAGCHEDPHESRMGSDCSSCHSQSNWLVVGAIADHARTRFPLVGAHAAAACFACHQGAEVGRFERVSIACIDCHADDLATALVPNHQALGWAQQDCSTCHTAAGWGGGAFKHPYFPLTGAHRSTACAECHVGGVYKGTPDTCVGCHQREYTAAPGHVAGNFSTSCQQCHSTATWQGASFSHVGIVNGCVACHLDDYNGTTNPNHAAASLGTQCQQCHGVNSWNVNNFNHAGVTRGCVLCHANDFDPNEDREHRKPGASQNCQWCHDTNDWDD